MNASVCAPASSSSTVDARIASSSPERVCISTTKGSIRASTSSSTWITMSGPSATMASSSSVTIVATSTITSCWWSRPVISRSIHTSTTSDLTGGTMTGVSPGESSEHGAEPRPADGFGRALAEPGAVERVELRSRFGFMAFHGGALERQTDRIAAAAARAAGASLYVVMHPEPNPPHFPSTTVNGGASQALQSFLDHVRIVVTVHGYGRDGMFTSLLLGGRNRELAARMRVRARRGAAGLRHRGRPRHDPRELRGLHADNPVNVPPYGGVQLELPPRVRGLGPRWADWTGEGFVPPAAALVATLADIARSWEAPS